MSRLGLGTTKAIRVCPPSSWAQLGKGFQLRDTLSIPRDPCQDDKPLHQVGLLRRESPWRAGRADQPPSLLLSSMGGAVLSWLLGSHSVLAQLGRLPTLHTEVKPHCPQDPTPLHLGDPLHSCGSGGRDGWETGNLFPPRGPSLSGSQNQGLCRSPGARLSVFPMRTPRPRRL